MRGNVVNKNGRQFIFDRGNRLRDIAEVEHYRYDGLGRRVMAWAPVLGSVLSQYDQAGRLIYQDDQRRQRVVAHIYLGGRLVAQRERNQPGGTNPQVTYLHTDALGSPAAPPMPAAPWSSAASTSPTASCSTGERCSTRRPGL